MKILAKITGVYPSTILYEYCFVMRMFECLLLKPLSIILRREYAVDVSGSFMRGWAVELPGFGVVHTALRICAKVLGVMGSDVILLLIFSN